MKKTTIILLVFAIAFTGVATGVYFADLQNRKEEIQSQLDDTREKISALPELEKDIFSKCMEGTKGTAQNIAKCQDTTQKEIHTLAQDLKNLKQNLEAQL